MADMHIEPLTLGGSLTALIERQLARYRTLTETARPAADAKPADVKAWEDARKAAVQHLQALLRAAQMANAGATSATKGGANAGNEAGEALETLLAAAVADVAAADDGEPEP